MNIEWNTIMLVNLGMIVFLLLLAWSGYKQGFLLKLVSILGFVVIACFAWWLSQPLSQLIAIYPKQDELVLQLFYEPINRIMIFVILFVLLQIVLLFVKPLLKVLSEIPVVSTINKIAGCILGMIQAIFMLFVVSLLLRLPMLSFGASIVNDSWLSYTDDMMEVLAFYAKEPLDQISVLFNMIDQTKTLSKQEITQVRDWLVSQNMKEEQVNAIIASLRVENER